MSSGPPDLNFPEQETATGQTSGEARKKSVPSQDARERLKQGLSAGFSFYECLLLVSLIFVTLACLQMYWNVNRVDPKNPTNYPFSFPYKTEEAIIGGS